MIKTDALAWHDATVTQVRGILRRNDIDAKLFSVALGRFKNPDWGFGPHVYLIDTATNKAARVTVQGPDEYDVKVSSRDAEDVFSDVCDTCPVLVDEIIIVG
jgi:hypothetical protein